jgi:hypothetical protein
MLRRRSPAAVHICLLIPYRRTQSATFPTVIKVLTSRLRNTNTHLGNSVEARKDDGRLASSSGPPEGAVALAVASAQFRLVAPQKEASVTMGTFDPDCFHFSPPVKKLLDIRFAFRPA